MKILIFEKFDESYLREEEWLVALSPVSCDLDDIAITDKKSEEEIHAFLDKNKATIQQNQIVLVSLFNLSLGLQIVHHIRLTEEYKRLPILLFGNIEETEIHKQQNDLSHICHTKGTRYFLEDDLTQQRLLSTVEELNKELNELLKDDDTFRDGFLKKIIIREPDKTGRHSIANQWGAYRMAQVAGLDIAKFNYPKTLYFKYLLAQSKEPEPIPVDFPIVKKILFVDDNYQKGWKDCLEGLFGEGTIEAYESWQKAQEAGANTRIESDEYDLVFLDFYLGEQDNRGTGQDILEIIKGKKDKSGNEVHRGLNPVIPVIMFTASNKAWNMDKLYEAGADGYYVKEHPDNAHDADFSVENFKNFHETVKKCLEKGMLLRQYWNKISQIKKDWNFTNKGNQKNKERIEERLTMFLGLLKKAYEQTDFDKNTFFYSEWELAFLTLWSTLNEIQEAYYEKNSNFIPFSYNSIPGGSQHKNKHPNNHSTIGTSVNWKISGTNDYLTIYKPKFDSSGQPVLKTNSNYYDMVPYTTIFLDDSSSSKFRIEPNYQRVNPKNDRYNYSGNLYMQIAFLISKIVPSNNTINRDILLLYVFECNEVRNKLYLTHGDDSSSLNFEDLYQFQRRTDTEWKEKIKQLFEIVYFLCTGKECDL